MRTVVSLARCVAPLRLSTLSMRRLSSFFASGVLLCSCVHALDSNSDSAAVETRGPAGRRHNFWWWLALGVSGVLMLLLVLLLALSWHCAARRRRRNGAAKRRGRDDEADVHSDGALSTSPDNFTARHGSHDTSDDAKVNGDAMITASTYVNTTRSAPQLVAEHNAAAVARDSRSDGGRQGRKRIFLAGAGKQKTSTASRGRSPTPPQRSAERVSTWSNTHHTRPPLIPAVAHATGAAALTPGRPQPSPVKPNRQDKSSEEDDTRGLNPLCVTRVQQTDEAEDPTAAVVVERPVARAGAPLPGQVAAASEAAAFVPSPSPSQHRTSCERVTDVPVPNTATTTADALSLPAQEQLQLAKSPMRSSVMAHNIRTAERPTAATAATITRGSSKQYFFGYQRKPANVMPGTVRAPTTSATTPTATAITATMRESPDVVSVERQLSPGPQEQRQISPPREQAALLLRAVRTDSAPRSPTPPSLLPESASANGSARPSSATPFPSRIFSPLTMNGVEPEAPLPADASATCRGNTPVEAAAVVATPIVLTERPPRHEHASPAPRVSQQRPAALSNLLDASPRAPHVPASTAKKRIELYRKGSHRKRMPSPPREKGRSGSAPAANGRLPLSVSLAQAPSATSPSAGTGTRTPSTVTSGVPQLFFGKREPSPVQSPSTRVGSAQPKRSPSSSGAQQHARPPRPDSAMAQREAARGAGSRKAATPLRLSAAQLTQISPSALLPTSGPISARDAAAAAAALAGGGRGSSSRQTSPSHYGSVSSSLNGGNSPSRTSLGRVRSSSRVKFLDQDGDAATPTATTTTTTTTSAAGVAAGGGTVGNGGGGGAQSGAVLAATSASAAAAGRPLSATPSSLQGSGVALKGRPLSSAAAKKEMLPDLPPVPATAQIVIEQGRRTTATAPSASPRQSPPRQHLPPSTAAQQPHQPPPPHTVSPSRQRAPRATPSPEMITPPFSAKTASPLEGPHGESQRAAAAVRPSVPRTRGNIAPASFGGDDVESLNSEASTMPAGILPDRLHVRQTARPQQPQLQQAGQSPSQQPLFSNVSPYSSGRRAAPSDVMRSPPRHPSGIEVLRITRASGDVQVLPPSVASQQRREADDNTVAGSVARLASGQLSEMRARDDAVARASAQATGASATSPRRSLSPQYDSSRSNQRFGSATSGGRRRAR